MDSIEIKIICFEILNSNGVNRRLKKSIEIRGQQLL